jgi:hypothetical protein
MRRSFLVGLVVPALAFAAFTFGQTKEAAAGPILGLDFDLGTAFQSQNQSSVDFSAGGGVRLGYRFVIPRTYIYVQPEIGGHYMHFGFNSQEIGYDYAGTLTGGIKVGLSGIVQPNVFTHVGLGFLGVDTGVGSQGYLGPDFDIGVGIDFRVWRGFLLGAQIAWNMADVPSANSLDAAKWMNFGVNASFHFGEAPPRVYYVR